MKSPLLHKGLLSLVAILAAVIWANSSGFAQKGGPRRGGFSQGPNRGNMPFETNRLTPRAGGHLGGGQGPGGPGSHGPQSSAGQPVAGGGGQFRPGLGQHGRQQGGQVAGDARTAHAVDMQAIQFLIANRAKIQRTVVNRPDGVETLTESSDPAVTSVLVAHVESMALRVKQKRPIHARDPLFAELFRNAETLSMKVERTPQGVKVVETSPNAYAARLIQAHAQVVSLFLANGPVEMRKNHGIPQ